MFRKVERMSAEESVYHTKISTVQQGIDGETQIHVLNGVTYSLKPRLTFTRLSRLPLCPLILFFSDLSSTTNCSSCLDVTLYSEEIRRLKREFEDLQRMILGQEQVRCIRSSSCLVLRSTHSLTESGPCSGSGPGHSGPGHSEGHQHQGDA